MSHWTPCPYSAEYAFDAGRVRAEWTHLHAPDAEPLPADEALLAAWALFHAGRFEQAEAAGLACGTVGFGIANRAAMAHATLLEPGEQARMALYRRVHARACAHAAERPQDASAWYWQGLALARHAQGVQVARALAQGIGRQVRSALEATLALAPGHAFAHAALGGFHAEVIDKVGPLVGAMAYDVHAGAARAHLREAQRLAPDSAAVLLEYAAALLMLDGKAGLAAAAQLQQQAAAVAARDAAERLWVELARTEL